MTYEICFSDPMLLFWNGLFLGVFVTLILVFFIGNGMEKRCKK